MLRRCIIGRWQQRPAIKRNADQFQLITIQRQLSAGATAGLGVTVSVAITRVSVGSSRTIKFHRADQEWARPVIGETDHSVLAAVRHNVNMGGRTKLERVQRQGRQRPA